MLLTQEEVETILASNDERLIRSLYAYLKNPLHSFKPHPDNPAKHHQQESFFNSRFSGIEVVIKGNASGGTYTATAKIAKFLLETAPPDRITPFWLVSIDMRTVQDAIWANLHRWLPDEYISAITWFRQASGFPLHVMLRPHATNGNQWRLDMKSAGQGRAAFTASNIGGFLISEPVPFDIVNECYTRCRNYHFPGSMIYELTPLGHDPELEKRFRNQKEYPDFKFFRMAMDANTDLPPGVAEKILRSTPPELREARRIGDFISLVGNVYKDWNSAIHIIENKRIGKDWEHLRGIDTGSSDKHPFACVWVAKHQDTYYVYDEYIGAGTVDEHLDAINNQNPWDYNSPYYGETWIDPANAMIINEITSKDNGIPTSPANKDLHSSINHVMELLRPDKKGKCRLYIFEHCTRLIEEFHAYKWHKTLPKPVGKFCDCLDALRYCLWNDHLGHIEPWENVKMPTDTRWVG